MTVRDLKRRQYQSRLVTAGMVIKGRLVVARQFARRAIAEGLGLETSCVAGRARELLDAGALEEFGLEPCPSTGRRVHWLRLPSMEQAA